MRQFLNIIGALTLSLLLSACGQAEFGTSGGDSAAKTSSVSDALGQLEANDEEGDANGEVHTVADLEQDPSLAELYACGKGKDKKVLICHVPPGNPAMAHTICIGAPALAAHVDNHHAASGESDALGECTEAKKKRCGNHDEDEE